MQAHLLTHFIEDVGQKKPDFPFVGVTISRSYSTVLKNYFDMNIIGETLDDAIGETFDKW